MIPSNLTILPKNARKWPLNACNSFIHILLPFIILNAFKGHVILMVITAHLKIKKRKKVTKKEKNLYNNNQNI